MTKLFFATDGHGSDICWSKFINAGKFYEADLLTPGGDKTGNDDMDKVEVLVCAELAELIPEDLEIQI